METTIIILACVNIAATLITPVIISVAYFIKHISYSECCGSIVELKDKINDEPNIEK